jgi:hypothetical protein
MQRALLAILLAAATGSTAALADAGHIPSFSSLDKNGDGLLSFDEVADTARLSSRFQAADINQDGYLDRAEFLKETAAEATAPQRNLQAAWRPAGDASSCQLCTTLARLLL